VGSRVPEYDETLAGIEIFTELSPTQLEAVGRRCHWRHYGPDQQILGHLDESRDIYFIVRGKVRATVYSLSGKEVTFRDIPAGQIFGEFAAIDGQPRSANIVALTDALIASLSAEAFWEVLRGYPEVSSATLKLLTRQIRILSERVFEFSALAVKNRIHAELLRLARDYMAGDNRAVIAPIPTHTDIAQRVSTHREAVTRELSAMARSGLVERRDGALVVPDVARLAHLVQEVLGDQL
jgi:CRP-like cAMP-binding protein